MTGEIIGRGEELGSIHRLLDHAVAGPTALVLEGEAGIGKSTLWLAGVEAARERGLRVLSSRPAEAERELAHVGLGDLYEDVLDDVLPALSTPRRRALEVAFLLEEDAYGLDPRTLGVAVRSSLETLAAEGPLVLAIDDVQWLDPSSASALAFALRRLDEQPILMLLARLGEGAESVVLETTLPQDRIERVPVGPLSLGAIQRLLREHFGRTFSRPTSVRVHETSGGNPFYALELARALGVDVDPTQPLPIPETLEGLVRARLDRLPHASREALALVSAFGRPSPELLVAAGVTDDLLEPAIAAHVVERSDGDVRFAHPLLASVLYHGLAPAERLRVHARLAEIFDDPLERAHHLALSTVAPEAEIAATLEEAATLARARGAPIAAAELAGHALRLTLADATDDRHRRAIAAARALWSAGESRRARALAQEVLTGASPGLQRTEALILVSDFEPSSSAIQHSRKALLEPGLQPAQEALIRQRLAIQVRGTEGIGAAEQQALMSLGLADQLDDDALRARALSALGMVRFRAGELDAIDLCEQAHELGSSVGDKVLRLETSMLLASSLIYCFTLDRARNLLQSLLDEWGEQDELVGSGILWHLTRVELSEGRLAIAASCAERSREIALQYAIDETEDESGILWLAARVAAYRGDLDDARTTAERSRALAVDSPFFVRAGCEGVLGLVDHWSGDARGAITHFAAAEAEFEATGFREPAVYWWRADYAEALLELGLIGEAIELLDTWEAEASRLGRDWVLAHICGARGLVAAAHGDVELAGSLLEQAVAEHEVVGDPFGRARALLALGAVRRRAYQRRAARESIEAALAAFEEMGASGWAEKARAELGRVGGRRREEGLTPAEQRVAALVAEGRTNREVAAALFLGERTVATHLTHIYRKLGVRSRTELAGRIKDPTPTR